MEELRRRRSQWFHIAASIVAVLGCTSPVPQASLSSPAATAGVMPTPSTVTATAAPTTATATPTTFSGPSSPPAVVLPGEPWIAYEGPVGEAQSVGNRVIRPDGTDDHWATPLAPISPSAAAGDGWQLHPDWSPDGNMLAFVVDTPGTQGHRDIWASNADGAAPRLLYDCQYPCDTAEFPAWSPDGKSVMFVAWDHANGITSGSRLEVVDLATGTKRTVAQTKDVDILSYPRWSPDGSHVVAEVDTYSDTTDASTLVATNIAVIDLTQTPAKFTTLTKPDQLAVYPDWNRWHDLIVFGTGSWPDADNGGDLWTIKPDGSDLTLLIHSSERAVQPTWLPDGSGVIYASVDGTGFGTPNMWTIGRDGSGARSATSDEPHFGTHPRLRPQP